MIFENVSELTTRKDYDVVRIGHLCAVYEDTFIDFEWVYKFCIYKTFD